MTSYKHATRWNFGDWLYHKVTASKGMVVGIQLRPQCGPNYLVVFDNDLKEMCCAEFELTEKVPTSVPESGEEATK